MLEMTAPAEDFRLRTSNRKCFTIQDNLKFLDFQSLHIHSDSRVMYQSSQGSEKTLWEQSNKTPVEKPSSMVE